MQNVQGWSPLVWYKGRCCRMMLWAAPWSRWSPMLWSPQKCRAQCDCIGCSHLQLVLGQSNAPLKSEDMKTVAFPCFCPSWYSEMLDKYRWPCEKSNKATNGSGIHGKLVNMDKHGAERAFVCHQWGGRTAGFVAKNRGGRSVGSLPGRGRGGRLSVGRRVLLLVDGLIAGEDREPRCCCCQ